MPSDDLPICLVYLPFTYAGSGVPEIAASLLPGIASVGLDVRAYVPRARRPMPSEVSTVQTLPPPLRYGRWRHVARPALWTLERSFGRAVRDAGSRGAVAYFWPTYLGAPSVDLIRYTQACGVPTVRQMVNTATSTSRVILDELHAKHQGGPHNISDELVAHEGVELPAHDYILAPGAEVGSSLERMGIPRDRIVTSSFGWSRRRFPGTATRSNADHGAWATSTGLRVLFVGIVGIRKGVPDLLEAWRIAGIDGQLLLVGDVDEMIGPMIDRAVATGSVTHLPFTEVIGDLYRSADVFVFPTHEEGGPLVTYEAAAHGLPIVTTPMGTAHHVEDGVTGVVVPAGDVDRLAAALRDVAASPERRNAMGAAAQAAAERFEYAEVGRRHGELLRRLAIGDPLEPGCASVL